MKDYLGKVAQAIELGVSAEDIHDMLLGYGMSEYGCFLTYIAGKMVTMDRTPSASFTYNASEEITAVEFKTLKSEG